MTDIGPSRFVSPATGDLPSGCTIDVDGDVLWVCLNGKRRVSVSTRDEAVHHAWLLTAFVVKDHIGYRRGWPEMGAFRGDIELAAKPKRVSPGFGIYFDWTYRWPTIKLLIRADYACWLLWRMVRETPQADFIRQTDPVLAWFFFHMVDRQMPIYGVLPLTKTRREIKTMPRSYDPAINTISKTAIKVVSDIHVSLSTFFSARKRLKRLIG